MGQISGQNIHIFFKFIKVKAAAFFKMIIFWRVIKSVSRQVISVISVNVLTISKYAEMFVART